MFNGLKEYMTFVFHNNKHIIIIAKCEMENQRTACISMSMM